MVRCDHLHEFGERGKSGQMRVLVVDDDRHVAETVRRMMLAEAGWSMWSTTVRPVSRPHPRTATT